MFYDYTGLLYYLYNCTNNIVLTANVLTYGRNSSSSIKLHCNHLHFPRENGKNVDLE